MSLEGVPRITARSSLMVREFCASTAITLVIACDVSIVLLRPQPEQAGIGLPAW